MYEIPQQLEYKEKIVFGLTFPQLMYALIFSPIIISILKMDTSIEIRILVAILPILLAVGFMFFDLSTHLKNWYIWFRLRKLNYPEKILYGNTKG